MSFFFTDCSSKYVTSIKFNENPVDVNDIMMNKQRKWETFLNNSKNYAEEKTKEIRRKMRSTYGYCL